MPFIFTSETVTLAIVIIAALVIIDAVWLIFITQKIKRLLGGNGAKDIEEALVSIRKDLDKFKLFTKEAEKYLETVEMRLKRSIQSVESIRFNPFKGTGDGGNQSFSTALIDENGNGVVVSGLYSRERVSIFSKTVKEFGSEYELTDEEQDVIKNAKKKLKS